jgi:hypothetical protein
MKYIIDHIEQKYDFTTNKHDDVKHKYQVEIHDFNIEKFINKRSKRISSEIFEAVFTSAFRSYAQGGKLAGTMMTRHGINEIKIWLSSKIDNKYSDEFTININKMLLWIGYKPDQKEKAYEYKITVTEI